MISSELCFTQHLRCAKSRLIVCMWHHILSAVGPASLCIPAAWGQIAISVTKLLLDISATIGNQPRLSSCSNIMLCSTISINFLLVVRRVFGSKTAADSRAHPCPIIGTIPIQPHTIWVIQGRLDNFFKVPSLHLTKFLISNNIFKKMYLWIDPVIGLKWNFV